MSIEPVLRWAADQVGTSARIVAVKGMRAGAGPWRLGIDHGGETVEAVLRIGDPDIGSRRRLATEAAALALAEEHRLAAPRLLAVDLDGDTTGRPALLMTVLAGSSTIPTIASVVRLRASGAAAAALHAVATTPRPDLPLRVRPLGDVDFAAQRRVSGSSPLLDAAEQRLHVLPMPQRMSVFVHGDLWQGNTLWAGEACVGMVDWDAAGVGHPGIDLGSLRGDAAHFCAPRSTTSTASSRGNAASWCSWSRVGGSGGFDGKDNLAVAQAEDHGYGRRRHSADHRS